MFKHILVPMDLSGGHQRALRVALALAVAYRARLTSSTGLKSGDSTTYATSEAARR